MEPPLVNDVTLSVQDFYRELPFSYYETTQTALKQLENNAIAATYPDLHEVLLAHSDSLPMKVIEFGCGAGWLSCTLAKHYNVEVTAIDFTAKAIERAKELAKGLGFADRIQFHHQNFLQRLAEPSYDLAISVGVLHHTADTAASFHHLAQFMKANGRIFVGLYHLFGRRPFLNHFQTIQREHGDEAALAAYAKLDHARQLDRTHLESWYRDQVIHPHETQHTLKEVAAWMEADQIRLESTSINQFDEIQDIELLFELEKEYEQISLDAIHVEQRYFPGFFTALGQMRSN